MHSPFQTFIDSSADSAAGLAADNVTAESPTHDTTSRTVPDSPASGVQPYRKHALSRSPQRLSSGFSDMVTPYAEIDGSVDDASLARTISCVFDTTPALSTRFAIVEGELRPWLDGSVVPWPHRYAPSDSAFLQLLRRQIRFPQ
jgi:hypothetical protein